MLQQSNPWAFLRGCGRWALPVGLCSTLFLAALAHAEPVRLEDGTAFDAWTLPNGLRVVTRDVPGSAGVSITLALRFGAEDDPTGKEGWAQLLAHVVFLSAAGEIPERTMDELESSRPLGWRIEIGPHHTRLTEVARIDQFAGVFHQMALRLRGVAPTAKSIATAQRLVKAQLAENYRDRPSFALYYQLRSVGSPSGYDSTLRYARAKGIEGNVQRDVLQSLKSWYVPANAILSLAGNLSGAGVDLQRVMANEFGSIPAGSARAPIASIPIAPATKMVTRSDIEYPLGTVGLIAPALADSTHPAFLMHALVVGGSVAERWGRTKWIPSPFQYSLFDDPELARFYPPVSGSDVDNERIREEYSEALTALARSTITREEFTQLHDGILWMLGGPLRGALLARSHEDVGLLAALSTTAAMREMWGGEAFWSGYRERFDRVDRPKFTEWSNYFQSPEHQVQLIFAVK